MYTQQAGMYKEMQVSERVYECDQVASSTLNFRVTLTAAG
jgi:hypothetical protein